MSTRAVNALNIGLMVFSLGIAIALPFELLLFSWVILGPAHYLTEISWLHDRQYFAKRKSDPMLLLVLGALIVLGTNQVMGESAVPKLSEWNAELYFAVFALGLVVAFVTSWIGRAIGALVIAIAAYALHGSLFSIFAFSLYLPTLLHVFVFTGCFILYGAQKGKGDLGNASLLVFLACAIAALLSGSIGSPFGVAQWAREHFHFDSIAAIVSHHLGLAPAMPGMEVDAYFPYRSRDELFLHPAAVATTRFLAYAYTYHYLNWFSKTSVIRWHEIPRSRALAVVAAYVCAVGLYFIDFQSGLAVLFGLSLAHVLLEFPLNHKTFASLAGGFVRFDRSPSRPTRS